MTDRDLRVVVAPDSFKGTLTAAEAASAIADGWRRTRPGDHVEVCPLSDGGDGLLAVVGEVPGWTRRSARVPGPTGAAVDACWLVRDDTALVESAQACGLHLVEPQDRDPRRLTTFGVGRLLDAARRTEGVRRVLVGLGGSATSDGGIGLLAGLGATLTDVDGRPVGAAGAADLGRIVAADLAAVRAAWEPVELVALSDVTTALGDAARVYGPQKGASPADVVELTAGLGHLADVLEAAVDRPDLREAPGTGAAGGLGFALAALGGRIESGATHVAMLVGLPDRLAAADLVIIGEGRLDATSQAGKVVGATAGLAAEAGVPVVGVVGTADGCPPGFLAVAQAAPDGPGADPAEEVAVAAARLAGSVRRASGGGGVRIVGSDTEPTP